LKFILCWRKWKGEKREYSFTLHTVFSPRTPAFVFGFGEQQKYVKYHRKHGKKTVCVHIKKKTRVAEYKIIIINYHLLVLLVDLLAVVE
jgi:hypothetical protein